MLENKTEVFDNKRTSFKIFYCQNSIKKLVEKLTGTGVQAPLIF